MQTDNKLGVALAAARKRRGISQRRLAELSGISNTTIASLERGRGSRGTAPVKPTPDTLLSLAKGLAIGRGQAPDERLVLQNYEMLMNASGYSWMLIDRQDAIPHQLASTEERETRFMEAMELSTRLTDLSAAINEAIENGKGGANSRELRFGVRLLEAYLDMIDPDREFRGPLGEDEDEEP